MMKNKSKKKVVARRNAGLGDNLLATAHAWYYAQQTGRDLEISWAPSMYFSDKSVNSFGTFFKVPEKIGDVNIIYHEKVRFFTRLKRRLPFFPLKYFFQTIFAEVTIKLMRNKGPKIIHKIRDKRNKWLTDFIYNGNSTSNLNVTFNTCFNFLESEKIKPFFDALELLPKYQERVDEFRNKHFKGKKVIGVHVRYYDKNLPFSNHTQYWLEPEKSFEHIKNELQKIVNKLDTDDYVIYLSTDNEIVFDYFRNSIDNFVVYNKAFQNITFTMSLHHKIAENSYEDDLIEMFLLADSNVLYRYPPSGSWFSFYGSLYADEVVMQ